MDADRESFGIPALIDAGKRGQLSRRHFMEGALALGISVPVASSLWSGQVLAATPKNGGTFRAGVKDANTTDNLDPGAAAGLYMIVFHHVCRSYLTEITPMNTAGPDSAESWETSPDAKRW